jgi:hypothetical protein
MKPWTQGRLTITENGRYFRHEDGTPFFWLGDTAWLLFQRLTLAESQTYFAVRRSQGYTVCQVMLVHTLDAPDRNGELPFHDQDMARPNDAFFDHIEQVFELAQSAGLYLAPVCVWGSIVHADHLSAETAALYGAYLVRRLARFPNLIWINGGDIDGSPYRSVWERLGQTIKAADPNHLMTFHPRGGMQSSTWFHQADWLDFNLFQSGHTCYGMRLDDFPFSEDNWRYVAVDRSLNPAKPTLDGEPSYEDIPHGLHDLNQPKWQAADVRRYAWWSVLAGAAGHTYGHNAVMQMYQPGYKPAYGNTRNWADALGDAGAAQMQHLVNLLCRYPYADGAPDQDLSPDSGKKYDRIAGFTGPGFAIAYITRGRRIRIETKRITTRARELQILWYDPRTGLSQSAGTCVHGDLAERTAPDQADWVLVLQEPDGDVAGKDKIGRQKEASE